MTKRIKGDYFITDSYDKQRVFFLGEIFWTERNAWEGTGFHYCLEKDYRPAIVLKKSFDPMPVTTAPGTTKIQKESITGIFIPSEPVKYKNKQIENRENFFILYLKRPVSRESFSYHLGTISGKDKQNLSNIINSEV